MNKSAFFAAFPLGFSILACGTSGGNSDGTGASSATGSTTSSGGVDSTGGATTGGASSGGGLPTGGASSGGGSGDAHCSPGTTEDGAFVYPYPIDNCGEPPNWTGMADLSFRDVTLETPIGPGDTYAFSADLNSGGGKYEIYGVSEKCGATAGALELLDAVTIGVDEIACFQAQPKNGTYTHLLWVWYGGGNQGDTRFCEAGTCPGR